MSVFLRSALFNATLWLSVLIYAPLSMLTAPFPYSLRYRFITAWAWFQIWLARHLIGIKYRVSGAEHLPAAPAVVLAKHQSTWETFAFPQIFPPFVWILKRELLHIPLFGWALRLLTPIAIDRSAGRLALEQLVTQGKSRLAEGKWIVVFPEGTRMAPGERGRYKIGGAFLAVRTGAVVVPVAHNAGLFWPRRGFIKRPGTVAIEIGPVIQTAGKTAEQVVREAEAWIEQAMLRLEPPR